MLTLSYLCKSICGKLYELLVNFRGWVAKEMPTSVSNSLFKSSNLTLIYICCKFKKLSVLHLNFSKMKICKKQSHKYTGPLPHTPQEQTHSLAHVLMRIAITPENAYTHT